MTSGKRGRRLGALLALALAALLAGCAAPALPGQQQRQAPKPLPEAEQVARVAMLGRGAGDFARMLDPGEANFYSVAGAQVLSLLYSGLLTLDARHIPVSALATSYEVSADGLRYTFHLRSDARFAEGTPLTSADVAFSLNRTMGECFGDAGAFFMAVKDEPALVANCQSHPKGYRAAVTTLIGDALLTPDETTLVIILARPDAALAAKLAEPYSLIVERSLVTRYGAQWTAHVADGGGQGTSGMYALAAMRPWSAQSDGALVLEASRDYWGPRPHLREVDIAVRSPISQQGTFPASDVRPPAIAIQPTDDIVYDVPLPLPSGAKGRNGLTYHTAPALATYFLVLDARTAPLDDARVRQALALALDKTALAKIVNGVATDHLIPLGVGAYPAPLSGAIATAPLAGDVERARALWRSYAASHCSGMAGGCPAIQVFSPEWAGQTPVELAIIARWRATLPGLRLSVISYDGTLRTTPQPSPAVMGSAWVEDYADPQDWLTYLVSAPGNPVYSFPARVQDARVGALAAQAEATLDAGARLALYQQAEDALINDAVVIPIAQEQTAWAVNPILAGIPTSPAPWIPPAAWARIALT
ncbi:MAG TPA: ABC transporter substrate-binding protein [Ktedonobacterales bacterium]|nr:ABC transporter substrate-binding protein [Ktedonobacterales bacterium]